jgi:hypothetical protein
LPRIDLEHCSSVDVDSCGYKSHAQIIKEKLTELLLNFFGLGIFLQYFGLKSFLLVG